MASSQIPTIDTLLRLLPLPNNPDSHQSGAEVLLLNHLPAHPALASAADEYGYTLLHAAASYASDSLKGSYDLLRALVKDYSVDVNVRDAEGDTPLFYAEKPETAVILVHELGADWRATNEDGIAAEENAKTNAQDEEGSVAEGWSQVAAYLEGLKTDVSHEVAHASNTATIDGDATTSSSAPDEMHRPPPLPPGVTVNLGNVRSADAMEGEQEPDPEFRARIEALAAREDFQGEEGQIELRRLVEDAIGGLGAEAGGDGGGGKSRRVD